MIFEKILIANRGEIACRVVATCRKLGVKTVAVHSDIDAMSRHVALADEAVSLGGQSAAESYLRGDAIIQAALQAGAQAIHPGYGFLSENPDFVEAVEAAGLVFIGPSAEAIRAMGLKDAAKALMEDADVPVVPGYHGASQDNLAERACEVGYPVLIKAVAGGGGKGMRRVDEPSGFEAALSSAVSEAEAAFGNGAVLIEKFVGTPRHIEVQVFGDGQSAVHLFERDCSLQRRHQKVIEEAPAPGMTDEMRAAMGEAAVRAAEAVGYRGAGTVEFIVDATEGLHPDRFYFMEMNTRLQVEHPVSEEITGVDLVEWQLRVASGEPLPMSQEDLKISGHSVEARLYAEDASAGFLPATGTLEHLQFGSGRIETGVREGDEISPWYDPMIAKLVVHGRDRAQALARMDRALSEVEIAGTVTNLAFLRSLVRHEGFARGDVDTGLIERDLEALVAPVQPCSKTQALAAVCALDPSGELEGFTLWVPLRHMVRLLGADGAEFTALVTCLGARRYKVETDENTHMITDAGTWHVDGVKTTASVTARPNQISVFWGNTYHFDRPDPLERGGDDAASDHTLAPMPGLVKRMFVDAGAKVEAGTPMLVLEAMKMEHTLRASRDGVVMSINVAEGAQVSAGDVLIQLKEESS